MHVKGEALELPAHGDHLHPEPTQGTSTLLLLLLALLHWNTATEIPKIKALLLLLHLKTSAVNKEKESIYFLALR